MTSKPAQQKVEPRTCHFCGREIPDEKPVFLVAQVSGRIVGPFHADCAASIVERQKDLAPDAKIPGMDFGRVVPNLTQEPLL